MTGIKADDQERRKFLIGLAAGSLLTGAGLAGAGLAGAEFAGLWRPRQLNAAEAERAETQMLQRPIPKTGEMIPALGMGTWITFNVGDDKRARAERVKVLRAFFEAGGGMIDSSPMYGSAEEVVGHCLKALQDDGVAKGMISASKIWTAFEGSGKSQFQDTLRLWGVPKMDVMQIHNLLNWQAHLKTLTALKSEGLVRYIGITTSHSRRHEEFAAIMRNEPLDFVQITYHMDNRAEEDVLLPLAAERQIAVIINRPFSGGSLFSRYGDKKLPDWAGEIGCQAWSQFFLKFILSHPAVTVAIPATSRVDHMQENMAAGRGALPDAAMRARMIDYCAGL